MRRLTTFIALILLSCPTSLLAADLQANQEKFDQIINKRCVRCHTRDRIDEALKKGENIEQILEKMLRFGVNLSERDREVLGTFWGEPLK